MKRSVLPAPQEGLALNDYSVRRTARAPRLFVRLSGAMKDALYARVRQDGYGERGASRWVREAFLAMTEEDPNLRSIGVGDELDRPHNQELHLTIPRDSDFLEIFRDKVLLARIESPMLDGAQSVLIRSAIRFRLDRAGAASNV